MRSLNAIQITNKGGGNPFRGYQCYVSYHWLRSTELGGSPLLPDRVVGGAEVDEEVPAPVPHCQQVGHGAQVHGEQAGPAPDGGHPPGGDPDVGVLGGQRLDLSVEVVGPLGGGGGGGGGGAGGTRITTLGFTVVNADLF